MCRLICVCNISYEWKTNKHKQGVAEKSLVMCETGIFYIEISYMNTSTAALPPL